VYLKSLVLKGFKSFADRSVLTFEPGITAVVGPNGSGKSNISDSVLWVLGERNAKNLRGQSMEDVIFAGSSARKPVSVAEVELVLDNSDGTLPVDYSEVSIGRRMYRSGESEYLINGVVARRMDVLDILHDSGLGTGTHSIISQGHLASILASKPEDRRALIEEAAGVLKHKQRKAKSERKLERMDDHLARVRDVVAEVERQVKPLERKAKRAIAYKEVSAELSQIELALAVDDLRTLQGTWDGVVEAEGKLVAQTQELHATIAQREAESEALQKKLQAATEAAGKTSDRYRRAQAASDKLDSQALLLHEKKRSAQTYVTDLELRVQADEAAAADLDARCAEAKKAADEAAVAREAADKRFAEARERTRDLQERKRGVQAKLDEATRTRRDALAQLEAVRAKQARTREILASNRAQEKLIGTHAAELEERLTAARQAAEEAARDAEEASAAVDAAKEADSAARARVGEAVAARDRVRAAADAAREARGAAKAEVRSLEAARRARTAANPLLAATVKATGEGSRALADVIEATPELSALIALLLGPDMDALIVPAADVDALAADAAAESASGAVLLVPSDARALSVPAGVAARRLVDEISYPADAAAAVESLLGNVVVCDTPAEARALAAGNPGVCAVTAQGAIARTTGALEVVRPSSDAVDAIAEHRKLEEARDRATRAEDAFAEAEAQVAQAEAALRDAQAESLDASQALAQKKGDANAARSRAQSTQQARSALEREQRAIESQRQAARKALEKAEPDAAELDAREKELSDTVEGAKADIDDLREALSPLRAKVDDAQNALAEAKLAAATAKERTDYTTRMLITREQDVRASRDSRAKAKANIARKKAAAGRIDPLIAVFERLAASAHRRTELLETQSAQSQAASADLHEQINAARSRTRETHEAFDTANGQLANVRVEKGRLEMQVQAAVKAITEDCDTPVEVAQDLPRLEDRAAVQDQADKLRRRIKNMGTINPDAAEEYSELKARYDYLQAQLDDMVAARRSLSKIVHVIDARMKDDFVHTFDEVNQNFQTIFGVLFPGGTGSLELVDPTDPENTGIEVNAQPRGKRVLKMSLLSGGEKSLVALALLFAVYKTRSTPFYILDEIEAALDDTNLRRLLAYLDSIRDNTQFIMITHQRRTMEMADVLYGISMQSDGVTKVMSQRLDQALRHAEG
jgi:chromosome segregation protein